MINYSDNFKSKCKLLFPDHKELHHQLHLNNKKAGTLLLSALNTSKTELSLKEMEVEQIFQLCLKFQLLEKILDNQ